MATAAHILLLISLAYMALLGYACSRPRNAATFWFMVMLACSTAWAVSYYFELTAPTFDAKVTMKLARFLFLPWLPMAWLLMTAKLFNIGTWIPRWFWWGASVLNVVSMVMSITSNHHSLFLIHTGIHAYGPMGILTFEQGPWYRFHNLYLNLLALFGLALMVVAWGKAQGARRRDLGLMILGFTVPLATNIGFATGKSPLEDINLAPFTMALSITVYAWEVLRHRMLDLIPLARNALLDHLPDPVLATDLRGRMADMNEAFSAAAGKGAAAGQSTALLRSPWRESLDMESGLLQVENEGELQWFDVNRLDIQDMARREKVGRLHVWRNVTQRHKAEVELRESEEQLRGILNSISEAVFIHDAGGTVGYVNRPMLAMYGLESEDQARSYNLFSDYSAPGVDMNLGRKAILQTLAGEKIRIPFWRARRPLTQESFDVQVVLQRIVQNGQAKVLATVTDMTEHLRHEAEQVELERIRADARLVNQQKRLLRDMHDGLGGIAANISLLANLGQQETDMVAKDGVLGKIETLAAEGNAEIRSLMNAMENREFIWTDWLLEIRKFGQAACAGRSMEFESTIEGVPPGDSLSLMAGISMFRMLKEAVTNAVKHSGASRLDMRLGFSPQGFEAVVQDNGKGFDAGKIRPGRGLTSIRKRAEELGGEMNCSGVGGTRCRFWIPLPIKYPVDGIEAPGSFPSRWRA